MGFAEDIQSSWKLVLDKNQRIKLIWFFWMQLLISY